MRAAPHADRARQRVEIDEGSARGVDEQRVLFQPSQLRGSEQRTSVRRSRYVKGDDIAPTQKALEGRRLERQPQSRSVDRNVVAQQFEGKGAQQLGHAPADASKAYDSHRQGLWQMKWAQLL